MNRTQFEMLRARPAGEPTLAASLLGDRARTLAYGYNTERHTVHVYLALDEIHVVTYSGSTLLSHEHGAEMPLRSLRPSKRTYPERTDYLFATLLAAAGQPLTFLPYPDGPAPQAFAGYHGSIIADGSLIDMPGLLS